MKALMILLAFTIGLSGCSPAGETGESRDPIIPTIY